MYNLPLCVNFVDFKAAFDSINREFIWKAFSHYGLPCKYIRILQAFFHGAISAVRHNGELSSWFDVRSGTGQGNIQGLVFAGKSMSGWHSPRTKTKLDICSSKSIQNSIKNISDYNT